MLLRRSRAASYLTKESGLIGWGGRQVGRAAGWGAKKALTLKGMGTIAGVGFTGAGLHSAISEGRKKALTGMNPNYIQAQNMGMVPGMKIGG